MKFSEVFVTGVKGVVRMVVFRIINLVFSLIITVTAYAMSSYGLYCIAKRNNVKNPWIAFVPILHYYIIGSICEEYRIKGLEIKNLGVVLPLVLLVQVMSAYVPSYIAFVPSLIAGIFIALVMHKFFYLFDPAHAIVFALICLFGRLATAVIILIIKDMPMQMSAGAYRYPFER